MAGVALTIMECPSCGRLWVGRFLSAASDVIPAFSVREEDELRGYHSHPDPKPTRQRDFCWGTPERVHRPDVEAAFILGGKEAAEALWPNRVLGQAVEAYEREHRGG